MKVVIPVHAALFPTTEARAEFLRALLEPTIAQNQILIRRFGLPSIYESAVRWQQEPWAPELEEFETAALALRRGWVDCDGAAAWRVAELRERGEHAGVKIYWRPRPDGSLVMHAEVRRADGRVEDPSRALGMGSARRHVA